MINAGELQNQSEFCSTSRSRVGIHEAMADVPDFDVENAERSIAMLPLRERSITSLIKDVDTIFNTFFYRTSLLSIVTADEQLKPLEVYNAILKSGLFRTLEDWGVDRPGSIAHYVLHEMPQNDLVLSIPDLTMKNADMMLRFPMSFLEVDFAEITKDANAFRSFMDTLEWSPPASFSNDSLLHKEMPADRNPNSLAICSAILARLAFGGRPLGLMVIGMPSFYNFGPFPGVLRTSDMKTFLLLVWSIQISLHNLLFNPR